MSYLFEKKLKEIIVSCGDLSDVETINYATNLIEDFEFGSINIMQLVVKIEAEFDIEISDEDLVIEKLALYRELVEIIEKKIGTRK